MEANLIYNAEKKECWVKLKQEGKIACIKLTSEQLERLEMEEFIPQVTDIFKKAN